MGVLRTDRVSGLGGANAIVGSTQFVGENGESGANKTVTFFKDSSLAPGTSDFCAEGWVYFNFVDTVNNTQLWSNLNGNFGAANSTGWALIRIGANNQFYAWNSSGWQAFGAGAPTVNTWHYIQLVRSSNVFTLYMDGTALPSTVANSQDLTHDEIQIGARDDGAEGLDGFISNFRLTIGSSAAALAGIVPTAASRVLSTDTKLLCCNDPGNVNNEDAQGLPTSTTPDNDVGLVRQGFASRFVPDKGEDHGTTFADGAVFDTLSYMVPPGGTTTQRGRGRGVFAGGYRHNAIYYKSIDYINIQSSGNFIDFGDLTQAVHNDGGCCSSSTRGIVGGGYVASPVGAVNTIEYVTIATTSNSTDFGDLLATRFAIGGPAGNETRGLFMGGSEPTTVDTIEYVTIASTGNSTDFGNLTEAVKYLAATSNSTRAVKGGGRNTASPSVTSNVIDYVTITTTGNATDFGDMSKNGDQFSASASTTRAVFGNRYSNSPTPAYDATFDYITLASTGNATDFGDADQSNGADSSSVSNSTRGVWAGGAQHPSYYNSIYYITIATTGNTIEFGDQNHTGASGQSSFSDSHGGLS